MISTSHGKKDPGSQHQKHAVTKTSNSPFPLSNTISRTSDRYCWSTKEAEDWQPRSWPLNDHTLVADGAVPRMENFASVELRQALGHIGSSSWELSKC